MLEQGLPGRVREPQHAAPVSLAQLLQERPGQEEDVVLALLKRRHVHGVHGEPVVEVLTERAAPQVAGQVAVGGGDHPRVDRPRTIPTHPDDLALLEDAQQLDLQVARQLPDLVQEERATARGLEAAGSLALRSGERALLVPEELALDQRLGDRAAVQRDERLVGPVALLVQGPGGDLLARPAVARDQDRDLRPGSTAQEVRDPCHGGGGAHEPPEAPGLAARRGDLADGPLELCLAQRPAHRGQQSDRLQGLGDEVDGPALQAGLRDARGVRSGQDHGGDTAVQHLRQELTTVPVGEAQVEQDELDRTGVQRAPGLFQRGGLVQLQLQCAELMGEERPEGRIVLDHQDSARARGCVGGLPRGDAVAGACRALRGGGDHGTRRGAGRAAGGAWRRARDGPGGGDRRLAPRRLATAPRGRAMRRPAPGHTIGTTAHFGQSRPIMGRSAGREPPSAPPSVPRGAGTGVAIAQPEPGYSSDHLRAASLSLLHGGPVSPLSLWRPRSSLRGRCPFVGIAAAPDGVVVLSPGARLGRGTLDMGWTLPRPSGFRDLSDSPGVWPANCADARPDQGIPRLASRGTWRRDASLQVGMLRMRGS